MPHLKHIGLTNFRVFGERTDIALAPLTILTGTNSSGKSSVLKAMQLLQENIADIGFLNFSDGEHKLGNFDMALNRNAKEKTMVFSLPFEYEGQKDKMYMDWIYGVDKSNSLQYGKLLRLSVCLKKDRHEVIGITPWDSIDIDLEYFNNLRVDLNFWINMPSINLDRFYGSKMRHQKLYKMREIEASVREFKMHNPKEGISIYVISLLNIIKEKLKKKFHFSDDQELALLFKYEYFKSEKAVFNEIQTPFKKLFKAIFENKNFDDDISAFAGEQYRKMKNAVFSEIEKDNDNIINTFWSLSKNEDTYNILGTQRKIADFYPYDGLSGLNDDFTTIYAMVGEILLEAFDISILETPITFKALQRDNFYYLEAVRANTQRIYTWQSQGTAFNQLLLELVKSNEEWQLDFINHWLNEFGIGKELKINVNEQGIGVTITLDGKPLADLGYGVTQFLPILIRICTMVKSVPLEDKKVIEDKKILYIEEPETNLHPKLQSKLADMFVDACQKFNLQIIVETHSEYLIRKLQYLTAKKEITPQMTVIHYFYDPKEERPEGEPQVKQINIQTDGRLTGQFGAGFYDETARLMTAILTGETLN